MKKAIGGAMVFNIIFIYFTVVFALLAATMSYAKAFRVSTRIVNAIEKHEGYNNLALIEIEKHLGTLGYLRGSVNCDETRRINGVNGTLRSIGENYQYCVYRFSNDSESISGEGNHYYSYAVVTYIMFDLPLVRNFKIPIVTKTNRIYDF